MSWVGGFLYNFANSYGYEKYTEIAVRGMQAALK